MVTSAPPTETNPHAPPPADIASLSRGTGGPLGSGASRERSWLFRRPGRRSLGMALLERPGSRSRPLFPRTPLGDLDLLASGRQSRLRRGVPRGASQRAVDVLASWRDARGDRRIHGRSGRRNLDLLESLGRIDVRRISPRRKLLPLRTEIGQPAARRMKGRSPLPLQAQSRPVRWRTRWVKSPSKPPMTSHP